MLHDRPRSAGELAQQTGLSAPAMSRHLRLLRQSHLIEETHNGSDARVRTYRLQQQRLQELSVWLLELEDMWQSQLDTFKQYAEGRPDES